MSDRVNIRPKRIAEYIISRFPLDSCKNLYTCITEAVQELTSGLDDLELHTIADRVQGPVRSAIDNHLEEYRHRKLPPKVYWSQLNSERLIGRCFVFRNDTDDVKSFKQKLRLMAQIQASIAALSWADFERFCRRFLSEEPGFSRVRRRRHDGGIDYYGSYIISQTHRISFAGQAKKYGIRKKIGPNVIRELAGAMRGRRWAFGVIMTTCGFTQGARSTAKRHNIDTIDGEQIAYRLIEKDVGIVVNNHPTFSMENFRSWLGQ